MQVRKSSVGAVFYHLSFFSPVNMQAWMFFCSLYGNTCLRYACIRIDFHHLNFFSPVNMQ